MVERYSCFSSSAVVLEGLYISLRKKAAHKTITTDDKRLQSTLKRIGVNAIPAIEEVNIFKDDVVVPFTGLQDILPNIIHQFGTDNLENLKKLAEQFQKQALDS
ncbi:nascent polypeptide-associated complex subunit beta-like [Arachis ipaensis]|uniref:nascent polypeptide-associated complex subunit beta-like n=1 Tax=Arachis ipaensis TaxID=130454 RepID=UPI000A2B706E|nr:nascent polypeptide-associated complex subunit beta-like [Arachis ipaensis]XP_020971308.1 nascent polypeptide-associated complex subunit beta-like [Arachis ipaensis]XP_020971309.1 nascent polypeptide-associated complex subunit beta-like [Arachis ipaensis]XP_020971310.1 nascent polypeptide-associated complex subunit beta-like [Arachis ipaensis]